ncbi:ABC transporter permease [Acuticoccus mangrovi]|uniref:ABC transporter permease n=1 Tax=Acuticoccus mangrovi TaxID=2796142 RepID=A0A934ISX8_9HYPH|nr:ABC transporter permease [Acuticoccus mangrovi]MBJ3778145.1 ABC transporter permease [Acuticoccus mangrovi]
MGTYIVKRILATIPVMALVAVVVFALLYFAPGDPAEVIAGDHASPETIAAIRQSLGLDQPLPIRFAAWAGQLLQGDLGVSVFSNIPVVTLILQRLEPTMSLMVLTTLIAVVVAVPMGVFAASRSGTWLDRALMGGAVLGFSVPVFATSYLLAWIFSMKLQWLPVQGYAPLANGVGTWFVHLILPSLALASVYIALIARITRTAVLEVLHQDYIRTAKAKGQGHRTILFVHALKNAAVPILTVIGLGVALLIGGAVVTESVFAIPGIGMLTVDAILQRDYPVIQGVVLFFSFMYVLVNLLVDIAYTFFDPRIEY